MSSAREAGSAAQNTDHAGKSTEESCHRTGCAPLSPVRYHFESPTNNRYTKYGPGNSRFKIYSRHPWLIRVLPAACSRILHESFLDEIKSSSYNFKPEKCLVHPHRDITRQIGGRRLPKLLTWRTSDKAGRQPGAPLPAGPARNGFQEKSSGKGSGFFITQS